MKISLIITTYNRIHLLRKTYLSVLHQSAKPDELVISDDGSSEDIVGGISDLVAQSDFPVKFVTQEDKGFRLARCRNNAVRESSGDFLVFFDQDLLFSAGYLKTLVSRAGAGRFVVGNPIRLEPAQNDLISDEMIARGDFKSILTPAQKEITPKQFRKERLYSLLYLLKLRRMGPKLRGGIVGFHKEDFIRINGYDEQFKGWGNEDDDLGVRLYAAGVRGVNPFKNEYALHLFHERFHNDERVNKSYQKNRMKEINRKNFRCQNGYEIYDVEEKALVRTLK